MLTRGVFLHPRDAAGGLDRPSVDFHLVSLASHDSPPEYQVSRSQHVGTLPTGEVRVTQSEDRNSLKITTFSLGSPQTGALRNDRFNRPNEGGVSPAAAGAAAEWPSRG